MYSCKFFFSLNYLRYHALNGQQDLLARINLLFSFLEVEAKNSKKGLWCDQTKTNQPNTTPKQVIDSFFTKKASEYGFSDGTFHPEQLITQDQLLKMIIIALFPQTKAIFLAESFYKLSQDDQVQQIVKYAIDTGILAKNEIQSSSQPVTVENALTIIARSLKLQETGTNTSMAIESLSSALKDNSMASQFQGVVDKVKNSASDPSVMLPVKETASSLFSSLSSFIKGGLVSIKEMGILRKIKDYADNATSELKQAQQSLNEAKSK